MTLHVVLGLWWELVASCMTVALAWRAWSKCIAGYPAGLAMVVPAGWQLLAVRLGGWRVGHGRWSGVGQGYLTGNASACCAALCGLLCVMLQDTMVWRHCMSVSDPAHRLPMTWAASQSVRPVPHCMPAGLVSLAGGKAFAVWLLGSSSSPLSGALHTHVISPSHSHMLLFGLSRIPTHGASRQCVTYVCCSTLGLACVGPAGGAHTSR